MTVQETPRSPYRFSHPGRPLVAIVGRPNVGKSSLFNRLAGRREAIVSDVAGTTRDRISAEVNYGERNFLIVDTGGLIIDPTTSMEAEVAVQVEAAIAEADVVVFMTDIPEGVMPADQNVADQLRRSNRPVVLVGNKADNAIQETMVSDQYALGLGEPIAISAYHNIGIDDLLSAVLKLLPEPRDAPELGPDVPHIAIVGRPNVGKSALANAMLGNDRSIVSDVPGTTRDALDSPMTYGDQSLVLVDTAGIRRRGSISQGIERYSVMRAVRAIDRADVAILVLDATELVAAQDLHVAGIAAEGFKGMVVVINKWDLADAERMDQAEVRELVRYKLKFMIHAPVRFTSALLGEGIDEVMKAVLEVHGQRQRWLEPRELQRVIMDAIATHLPPRHGHGSMKIYRVKQESVGPPTFVFYCNNPHMMHFSYERYLENTLRDAFGFQGTHLRLEFRGKGKIHVIGGNRAKAKTKLQAKSQVKR